MLPVAQARDCIFLQPDNTCSIHQVRPLQCSTYPWWPDLMIQEEWVWERGEWPVGWGRLLCVWQPQRTSCWLAADWPHPCRSDGWPPKLPDTVLSLCRQRL